MKDRTWAALAGGSSFGTAFQNGARIADVAPNPTPPGAEGTSAVINDWTGGCCNQALREVYLPAQGGHNGYFGNEVYALTLAADVPAWQRIWGPTPNAQVSTDELGYNPPAFSHLDGNPRATHGWFHVFCDANGRLWLTMIDNNPSGSWGTNVYSIDRNNLDAAWMYHGRLYPSIPDGQPGSSFSWQGGPGAFDSASNRIWKCADFATRNGTVVLDCAAAAAAGAQNQTTGPQTPGSTQYNTYLPNSMGGGWSDIFAGPSSRYWVIAQVNSTKLQVMDILEKPGTFAAVATTGQGRWVDGDGAAFHAPSGALLVYGLGLGANIMKLSLSSLNALSSTYTWSQVAPDPSNDVTPIAKDPSQFNGLYSKFQLVKDMGNGQGALIVPCNFDGPTYVYKLPASGL